MATARSARNPVRLGIFGGTFDPVHFGHLRCADEAREIMGFHRVVFVPSFIPPHKNRKTFVSAHHRLAMVRLAIRGNPSFSVSDYECRRKGPSYSVDTLRHLSRTAGSGSSLTFILGSDAFREIPTWKEYDTVFHLCDILVLTRPGSPSGDLPVEIARRFCYDAANDRYTHSSGRSVYFRRMIPLDISSTDIRERVGSGRSIAYLVPPPVVRYIAARKLYRGPSNR